MAVFYNFFKDYLVPLFSVLAIFATAWQALKRTPAQNTLDDSSAALNFQKVVIKLTGEVESLKAIVNNSELEMTLKIKLGEKPDIVKWQWTKKEEDVASNYLPTG